MIDKLILCDGPLEVNKINEENLNPRNITFRLHTFNYPLEDKKFLDKVKKFKISFIENKN